MQPVCSVCSPASGDLPFFQSSTSSLESQSCSNMSASATHCSKQNLQVAIQYIHIGCAAHDRHRNCIHTYSQAVQFVYATLCQAVRCDAMKRKRKGKDDAFRRFVCIEKLKVDLGFPLAGMRCIQRQHKHSMLPTHPVSSLLLAHLRISWYQVESQYLSV